MGFIVITPYDLSYMETDMCMISSFILGKLRASMTSKLIHSLDGRLLPHGIKRICCLRVLRSEYKTTMLPPTASKLSSGPYVK